MNKNVIVPVGCLDMEASVPVKIPCGRFGVINGHRDSKIAKQAIHYPSPDTYSQLMA